MNASVCVHVRVGTYASVWCLSESICLYINIYAYVWVYMCMTIEFVCVNGGRVGQRFAPLPVESDLESIV